MYERKTLSSFSRTLSYLEGIRISNKHIYTVRPPRRIAINGSFFRSAVSAFRVYAYLLFLNAARAVRRRPSSGSIAFTPQSPAPWYNIWIVVQLAGLKITSDAKTADYVFQFEDATLNKHRYFHRGKPTSVLVNSRINDVGKSHVAEVFEHIFGYSLSIDPMRHIGPAVSKSEENGAHDGAIVECPIKAEEVVKGRTYQRLVDSTFNGKTSEDLRIIYVLGGVSVVFHKHKKIEERFGTEYLSVDVRAPDDVFSTEEIGKIIEFCEAMGLDFGAVDVMRDKHDGKIYIVDVNKTCMPVLSLTTKEQIDAQSKIARDFLYSLETQRAKASV